MTNCTSLSGKGLSDNATHESSAWFDAETCAGVRFRVGRVSVTRRIELARRIREIGRNVEFLEAGNDVREKIEAAVLAGEIDRAYLEWGLEEIQGLTIDGERATPAALIEKGPMALASEILKRIERVRAHRGRTKKLTVAFHFLRGDQSGWKCDGCRRQALEARRRCGFIAEERRGAKRLVWARGRVATDECPKSLVTPQSIEFLELYFSWKWAGGGRWLDLRARELDAFVTIEEEWRAEVANGK